MVNTTVAGVVRAIRKNGWEQAFGDWGSSDSGKACALGQAAKNLGRDFHDGAEISEALNQYKNADGVGLGDYIIRLNDDKHLSLADIAKRVERVWADFLDERVTI